MRFLWARVKGPCWHEMPNGRIGIDSGPMLAMKPNGHRSEGMLPQKLQITGLSWSDMPQWPGSTLNYYSHKLVRDTQWPESILINGTDSRTQNTTKLWVSISYGCMFFVFSLAYIYIYVGSGTHLRWSENALPYNGSAPQSSLSPPTYIPLNLQPVMAAGPSQA